MSVYSRADPDTALADRTLVELRGDIHGGAAAEAAVAARVLTREHPLREEAWRLLALALYTSGRQAEGLAALRQARRVFADELGLDPSPALVDLEAAMLAQRLPRWVPATAVDRPVPVPAASEATTPVHGRSPGGGEVFVGRQAELAGLMAAAREAAAGDCRVVLLSGEAGSGKSALLGRLAVWLDRSGWQRVTGRCPEDDGAPPAWAWVEALGSLAARMPPNDLEPDLAPLLGGGQPAPLRADPLSGRFRLHRAVCAWVRRVAGRGPVAVFIDDLHRGDAETLALLTSAADELAGEPVLLVAAYRPGAGEAGSPEGAARFDDVLAALAQHSPHRVALGGLAETEAAELVTGVSGTEVDAATLLALTERTGGNPFYLRESARLLASEGALVALSEVPQGVRDVLRRRLARLPPQSVAVLRLAAVVGPDVDVDVLVDAAGSGDDAVLDALEAGMIADLLTEPEPGRVRFVHVLVRDTLYADLSHLRRARLHGRVAAAVERLRPDDVPALAHHYAFALAADTAARGMACNVAAAELAERRYADDLAAVRYEQALRCLDRIPADQVEDRDAQRVDLLGRKLRAHIRAGALIVARATRDRAVALAEAAGREDLLVATYAAWTEPTPWEAHPYGRVDERTVARIEHLLDRADLDPTNRCRLLSSLAWELVGENDPRALPAVTEAVDLARTIGDPVMLGLALAVQLQELRYDSDRDLRGQFGKELTSLGSAPGLVAYRVYGEQTAAQVAAARLDLPSVRRHLAEADRLARAYQLGDAQDVNGFGLAMLDHITGRFDTAERRYVEAADNLRHRGSLHNDFRPLALFTVRASQGRLPELLPKIERFAERHRTLPVDALAAALAAAGRIEQARRVRQDRPPLRRDYVAPVWATIRTMALAAVGERDGAEELVEFFRPIREQLAGAGSGLLTMRPVAHSLGELALLLARPAEAAECFDAALAVARRCGSAHWAASAEAALRRARR